MAFPGDHSPTYIHPGLHLGLLKFLSFWRTPRLNYSRNWGLPKAQKLLKMSSYCNIAKVAHWGWAVGPGSGSPQRGVLRSEAVTKHRWQWPFLGCHNTLHQNRVCTSWLTQGSSVTNRCRVTQYVNLRHLQQGGTLPCWVMSHSHCFGYSLGCCPASCLFAGTQGILPRSRPGSVR